MAPAPRTRGVAFVPREDFWAPPLVVAADLRPGGAEVVRGVGAAQRPGVLPDASAVALPRRPEFRGKPAVPRKEVRL